VIRADRSAARREPGRTPRPRSARLRALLGTAILALGAAGLPAGATAPRDDRDDAPTPPADYAQSAMPRALAIVPGAPHARPGISRGSSNELTAATEALADCRAVNGADAPCELLWLNDERITTGAEIRARLPAEPHPLFLWRYESPVATVYLAGSIHVLKRSLHPLPGPFEAAFQSSDRIVVEVDLTRHAADVMAERMLAHALLPAGTTLATVAPPDLMARLETQLQRYGLTPTAVAQAKPALVTQQLALARLLTLGYDAEHGLEQYYLDRRGDRTVLELESLEEQLALLFDQPLATQLEMLDDALALTDTIEPVVADLLTAWLGGDDAAFLEAFNAQGRPSPRLEDFKRAILDDRNGTMTARIAALLRTPGTYFVLVGAAHLIGDSGIVSRLAGQGIEGRRIDSDDRW
jgi:uncharacterized protein YbaP (TraB family)